MGDLLNSKFVKDLQDGKLPPIELTIPINTLYQLAAVIFFTGIALIMVQKIMQKL